MLQTSARLLELLALLQRRRGWSGRELAEELGVDVRTLRRDVDRLRSLGYPVDASRGVGGGYALAPGASLPPLLLDDDEAAAIAVGLRTAAESSVSGIEEAALRALVKLEQVLPERLRRQVTALGSITATVPQPGPPVDLDTLSLVATCCRERLLLSFGYSSRSGAGSERIVEPHSLLHVGRRWYLVAWDRDRLDWRSFRLDRVSDAYGSAKTFVPRTLPAESPAEFVRAGIQSMPSRHQASVVLAVGAARAETLIGASWGEIEPIDENSCRFRTGDDEIAWLAVRLLTLDVEFEVEGPPELTERLKLLSGRIAAAVSSESG